MKKITIYTDGACKGNPGPGGWGAVLIFEDKIKKIYGGERDTTNNKMELTAVIKALETLTEKCEVNIFTDSSYVKNGIETWLQNWIKKNWKSSTGKEVKNQELWKNLSLAESKHFVKWHWVKGHSEDEYNDIADELANMGVPK